MSENTVTAEGRNVNEAVAKAAGLGIEPAMVDHKIDVSHFRNEDGRVIPRDTVKIIAKAGDPEEMKARAAKRKAQPRRLPQRATGTTAAVITTGTTVAAVAGRTTAAPPPGREERPAYDGDDSGAQAGKAWLEGLFQHMGVKATLKAAAVAENEAVIDIDSPSARHLVGRRGSNLRAIRALSAVMERTSQEGWTTNSTSRAVGIARSGGSARIGTTAVATVAPTRTWTAQETHAVLPRRLCALVSPCASAGNQRFRAPHRARHARGLRGCEDPERG